MKEHCQYSSNANINWITKAKFVSEAHCSKSRDCTRIHFFARAIISCSIGLKQLPNPSAVLNQKKISSWLYPHSKQNKKLTEGDFFFDRLSVRNRPSISLASTNLSQWKWTKFLSQRTLVNVFSLVYIILNMSSGMNIILCFCYCLFPYLTFIFTRHLHITHF